MVSPACENALDKLRKADTRWPKTCFELFLGTTGVAALFARASSIGQHRWLFALNAAISINLLYRGVNAWEARRRCTREFQRWCPE
jgi:hypothetical protein